MLCVVISLGVRLALDLAKRLVGPAGANGSRRVRPGTMGE
jgi:hypothetical protein